jgi:hypothetical protein
MVSAPTYGALLCGCTPKVGSRPKFITLENIKLPNYFNEKEIQRIQEVKRLFAQGNSSRWIAERQYCCPRFLS